MDELIFLKLGGSLITDKTRPFTARLEKLADLAAQIADARRANPGLRLVLGHGSGSFGHTVAREYATRQGVSNSLRRYWQGFSKVWYQASALNRLVMDALQTAGEDTLTFSPVSAVIARQGKIAHWNLAPLQRALASGMLPVVHGDVVLMKFWVAPFSPLKICSPIWREFCARSVFCWPGWSAASGPTTPPARGW